MAQYECPNCGGGFPEPGPENECVWCGQQLDGAYSVGVGVGLPEPDTEGNGPGPAVTRVEQNEDSGFLEKFRGGSE